MLKVQAVYDYLLFDAADNNGGILSGQPSEERRDTHSATPVELECSGKCFSLFNARLSQFAMT